MQLTMSFLCTLKANIAHQSITSVEKHPLFHQKKRPINSFYGLNEAILCGRKSNGTTAKSSIQNVRDDANAMVAMLSRSDLPEKSVNKKQLDLSSESLSREPHENKGGLTGRSQTQRQGGDRAHILMDQHFSSLDTDLKYKPNYSTLFKRRIISNVLF